MGDILCINAAHLSSYALTQLHGGETAYDRVLAYAGSLEDVDKVVLLVDEGDDGPGDLGGAQLVRRSLRSDADLMRALVSVSTEYENLIYTFADAPFLDSELTADLRRLHRESYAEYSFVDGYPAGLCPEIIRTGILPALAALSENEDTTMDRESVFRVLSKDINAFDVETDIAPVDLRMLRIQLYTDTRAGFLLCRALAAAEPKGVEAIIDLVEKRPDFLRTLPAFLGVQIIEGCPQACSYCPFPRFGSDILQNRNYMPSERFTWLVGEVTAHAPELTIGISTWGEPALHPEIGDIIAAALSPPHTSLLIETSGIGWDPSVLDAIPANLSPRITWIVSLDANDPELYQELRGAGFEEAQATMHRLAERFPGQVYPQAVRMHENEEHLEHFYRYWKDEVGQVIIQKYDDFHGELPQKKVTDLSPLERFPCWHLKRDLTVLTDGSVPRCREDISRTDILGNIFGEGFEAVWERNTETYLAHTRGNYPGICANCDEYYTFNF
jgi:spiro-SPASM protein